MGAYILRRILLMIPTLFGIMLVSFVVMQFAPGGPVEQAIAQLSGTAISATARVTGTAEGDFTGLGTAAARHRCPADVPVSRRARA